ncbi:MAG: 30S ribosomal protein S16 [Prevotella sp.]|jgi:small subunit ribosomal protein S16|nr:30S ribosomal protein S16 [Prevotella sp.]
MATRIRLQRGGHKAYAVYRIVIADARASRNGKFTEKIGVFNPNTNPASVTLNFNRALYWVEAGAQPTDTVRNILKGEGVYMMKHLHGGVKKGAFDDAEAQKRFEAWKADKEQKAEAARNGQEKAKNDAYSKTLEAEKKVNETIAKKIADKNAAVATAKAEAEAKKAAEEAEKEAAKEAKKAEAAKPAEAEAAPAKEAAPEAGE